ncbi:hypothetical protein E5288_WYG006359 [Bos mutus]|uniref:Uncharacterized protein n=1 Tax=Bos mutus TaxID=72004 RepID=A0A6B0QRR7_9CETA|nr:hypothetical protein [Bos mutus]
MLALFSHVASSLHSSSDRNGDAGWDNLAAAGSYSNRIQKYLSPVLPLFCSLRLGVCSWKSPTCRLISSAYQTLCG